MRANAPLLSRRSFLAAAALTATMPLCRPLWARGPAAYPPPDRELMVSGPGGRLYVRINGDLAGGKLPAVFIHGGPGGNHTSFLDALALAGDRAVILYDQLDSGLSGRPGNPDNWTVDRFTDEVEAVRTALGVSRWHVVGHSWGGTIALEYGARRPEALAGLVLASPLVSTASWMVDANALRAELPDDIRATLAQCDPPAPVSDICDAATEEFYARYNRREPPTDGLTAYREQLSQGGFNAKLYETMWGRSEFVATGSLADYDGEPLLERLDGPNTLFLVGQYDEARPVTTAGFAARVPGAGFGVVPGAAHGIFSDRPAETLGILRPWLTARDGGAA